jgi:uncharacterized protein (DUF427 family)
MVERHVLVQLAGETIAEAERALKVMETSLAPSYYVSPDSVRVDRLSRTPHATVCEWKGTASYFTVSAAATEAPNAAWTYEEPDPGYEAIAGWISFYPQLLECYLDGERVRPQPGHFYGGWVTNEVTGPFKGARGTQGW